MAYRLLEKQMPTTEVDRQSVVFATRDGLTSAPTKAAITVFVQRLDAIPNVESVSTPFDEGSLISKDGRIGHALICAPGLLVNAESSLWSFAESARRLDINISAAARKGVASAVRLALAESNRAAYLKRPERIDPFWAEAQGWASRDTRRGVARSDWPQDSAGARHHTIRSH